MKAEISGILQKKGPKFKDKQKKYQDGSEYLAKISHAAIANQDNKIGKAIANVKELTD